MFRGTDTATAPPNRDDSSHLEPVPLSVLELDLSAPTEGWATYLADRGISITIDDIGRIGLSEWCPATPHRAREAEVRRREKAAELERQAVEQDQQRRAQIWRGVPGGSAACGMCTLPL
jgi:hypothetical protein